MNFRILPLVFVIISLISVPLWALHFEGNATQGDLITRNVGNDLLFDLSHSTTDGRWHFKFEMMSFKGEVKIPQTLE